MEIPKLETERLVLRGQERSDTEALVAALADPGFARFITLERRALDRREALRNIAFVAGQWATAGIGQWIVEERGTGLPIGRVGPWAPEGWPDFEIAYAIVPHRQGRGYAVEAAAAAIAWAHRSLGRDHVIHLIDPANLSSQKVAAALGAQITGSWASPFCTIAQVWTTRWERFVETRPGSVWR